MHCLAVAVVSLLASRSLHKNGSICHIIVLIIDTCRGIHVTKITGSRSDESIYWCVSPYNYTQSWELTITDCLRLAPFLARPLMTDEGFLLTTWTALNDICLSEAH
jgi:hypothetical protein